MTPIVTSHGQRILSEDHHQPSPIFQCLSQQVYMLNTVRVVCWLCEGIIPGAMGDEAQNEVVYTHTVGLYSHQSGLVCLDFKSFASALEAFSLLTRYEVSPYHAEDVLEDRDIVARIRYL